MVSLAELGPIGVNAKMSRSEMLKQHNRTVSEKNRGYEIRNFFRLANMINSGFLFQ